MFSIPNAADAFHAHQAAWDSTDLAVLAAAIQGNGVVAGAGGECAVAAQAVPDWTVQVADGVILVEGQAKRSNGAGSMGLAAADATHPRWDLVYLNTGGTVQVDPGTPAANPELPALPGGVVLAALYIPANDTTLENNQIIDKRCLLPFGGVFSREATELVITNDASEQTLWSVTVPGDLMGSDRAVRVHIEGLWLQNTGASQTLTVRVKLGGTTLYEDSISVASVARVECFWLDLVVSNRDATNAQWLAGYLMWPIGAATTGRGDLNTDEGLIRTAVAGTAAVATTADADLVVSIQHGVASSNMYTKREYAFAELV